MEWEHLLKLVTVAYVRGNRDDLTIAVGLLLDYDQDVRMGRREIPKAWTEAKELREKWVRREHGEVKP